MLFNHTKTNGCWIENLTSQVVTTNFAFLPGFSITLSDPNDVTCPSDNPMQGKFRNLARRFFRSQDEQKSPPLIPSSAGFQFNPDDAVPEIFEYLRIPSFSGKHDKFVIQITSIVLFGLRKGLSEKYITDISRIFLRHKCRDRSDPSLYYKSLIHLWSLEQPAFYNLINKALAEANQDDLHLLRYIIYDYFMLFWTKAIPYYAGILYRGIHVPDEIINELYEFIGKTICFTCFTSTTKNRRRADLGGNVLFIIETISSYRQDIAGNNSNADISTISQFPEEEEVLYPPLTSFILMDIQKEKDLYVIRLTEVSGCSHMLAFFHDLNRRRTPNSVFTGLHFSYHTSSYGT
ncbi:unnamed protein product [Adineta steineri]|nr:unnamed protein product [Adineta steineri]CAF0918720.1 unnamed protein product [Adineta steineri]